MTQFNILILPYRSRTRTDPAKEVRWGMYLQSIPQQSQ